MSFDFSIRNAVIVALMQVGVIVAGVLACGITDKFLFGGAFGRTGESMRPFLLQTVLDAGFVLLTIPLVWISAFALLSTKPQLDDRWKFVAMFSGPIIIAGLIVFFAWVTSRTVWICILRA